MYKVGFGNNIEGDIEELKFKQPFGNRNKTGIILEKYSDEIMTKLVGIDGTAFSTNILKIKGNDLYNNIDDCFLLKSGIDGVILTGLNDIDSTYNSVKKNIGIILGVGDCASIIGSSKDGNEIFNIHGGYKGIIGLDNDCIGIIANFSEQIGSKIKDLSVHISPMAGSDFELDKEYIEPLIINFIKNYKKLNIHNYYTDTIFKDNKQKGNINLRQLIIDVLKYHGVKNISYSDINTTDVNNNRPSYRNYSKGLQDINGRLTSTIKKRVS